MTQMRRRDIGSLFDSSDEIHAGLWLARGLAEWSENDTQKGEDFHAHIKKSANLNPPEIYKSAYARWEKIVTESTETMATWCGQLDGRLFIGLGEASVLETAITLSRTYGVPMIPGSAIKGLIRAYAETQPLTPQSKELLFGKLSETAKEDSFAGYVLFHNAWWIPDSAKKPLCQEIVTVHHQKYYSGEASKATDFDSPIPNSQIAAQGSFLFVLECGKLEWAECARDLLVKALMEWGIGGKIAAGYGRFIEDKKSKKAAEEKRLAEVERIAKEKRLAEEATLTPEEKVLRDLQQAFEKAQKIQEKAGGELSQFINGLFEQGAEWDISYRRQLAEKIEKIYDSLKWWGNSRKKQEKKAKLAKLQEK